MQPIFYAKTKILSASVTEYLRNPKFDQSQIDKLAPIQNDLWLVVSTKLNTSCYEGVE